MEEHGSSKDSTTIQHFVERVIKILTSQKIREMIAIYKTCKDKTLDVYVWWHYKKEIEKLEAELASLGDTDES